MENSLFEIKFDLKSITINGSNFSTEVQRTLTNFGVNTSLALSNNFFKSMLNNSNTMYKLASAIITSYN